MDDNRLRGFSPPPWAALGRRDPEHEQAPWRESENVEDRRQMGWGDYLSAKANQVGHTFAAVPDVISAMGTRPASDELMQRYMEEISRSLPQNETPRMGPNDKPFYYAGRAEGGAVESERRMDLYEDELSRLESMGVPSSEWPSYQAFLRGLDGKADGGAVDQPRQPSFSEPLSGFIDKTLDGVKDYGRGAMDRAGWAPWAKGAGEVAMGVAATPFEAVSSASKLAMAPADWATGREVMASPWDVLGALPLAATGGLKALRHALDVSDLKRGARATEDFIAMKRDKGDFLPADLRIKQIIDEMAARRNMD